MSYYQEITIIPAPEISAYFIWSKLYIQLHLALADLYNLQNIDRIGVSFPHYQYEEKNGKTFARLGDKLRIFASTEGDLQILSIGTWLERLADYVHISSIKPVPETIKGYAVFSRYRPHFDIDKVAERFARHKNIGLEAALEHCKTHKAPAKMLPFIQLKSQTNGHAFRLAIQQRVVAQAVVGSFSTYGLSQNATVPIF